MLRRLFWLSLGAIAGSTGSIWLMAKLRERVDRYRPDRLARNAATSVRTLPHDVRASVADGRRAMRDREARLRAELAADRN